MPGSIATASPSGVLPYGLCTKFSMSRQWASVVNEYHDGQRQSRSMLSATSPQSRRSWRITRRLKPTEMVTLYNFWLAHPTQCFYFYDPFEVTSGQPVGSNYDPTGVSVVGRYTVRFGGDWIETVSWPRSEVSIELVEVA